MADWLKYPIKPLQHGMETDYPSIYTPHGFNPQAVNLKFDQHSAKKPWGYYLDRAIGTAVYHVCIYLPKDGGRFTIYLTDTDACLRKTGTSETFSYITKTYATGTASLASTTLTGTGTGWAVAGVESGDKFIFDDDHSANIEPDTNWATITGTPTATEAVLSAAYTGSDNSGAYKIRQVYSLPSGERWSFASVDDKFCFTNGNTNVQYWTGSGYAADLNSTYATKARYCMEYANRLWLADTYDSGVRDPYLLRGSKEGDPTDWTDSTAQDYEFIETDDIITGLGKVGKDIVVYKKEGFIMGSRSGNATDPIDFDIERKGVGCIAPYSILSVMGTQVFLSRDGFYKIDGDYPKPIAENIRHKFHDIVDPTEAEKTWGFVNTWQHECIWFANTSDGQYAFVWDYLSGEWYLYQFPVKITGAGTGAV